MGYLERNNRFHMNRQIFSEKNQKMTESVKTEKFGGNNRKTSNVWVRAKE